MDVRGKFGEHEIPLTNRVRGPHCMLQNEFFRSDLWQSTKCAGALNRAEKTRLVLTVSTYVINQQNFLRYLHPALKGDVRWTKSVQSG